MTSYSIPRLLWGKELTIEEREVRFVGARAGYRMALAMGLAVIPLSWLGDMVLGGQFHLQAIWVGATMVALAFLAFHPKPILDASGKKVEPLDERRLASIQDAVARTSAERHLADCRALADRSAWLTLSLFGVVFALAFVGYGRAWIGAAFMVLGILLAFLPVPTMRPKGKKSGN